MFWRCASLALVMAVASSDLVLAQTVTLISPKATRSVAPPPSAPGTEPTPAQKVEAAAKEVGEAQAAVTRAREELAEAQKQLEGSPADVALKERVADKQAALEVALRRLAEAIAAAAAAQEEAGEKSSDLNLAVPAGASATTDFETTGAGATIGFQVWKEDRYLLGAFFSYAPSKRVAGTDRDFGSFLLNPPAEGTSMSVFGNKMWSVKVPVFSLMGASGRAGVTSTAWEADIAGTKTAVDGFVSYFNVSYLVTTNTYHADTAGNKYQIGFEIGPTVRILGGDLGQNTDFRKSATVLGTDTGTFLGLDATFFVRLNAVQPYVRVSYVKNDVTIRGLTGFQAVFGVNALSAIFQTAIKKNSTK